MRGAIASFSENRTISQVNNGSLPQLIQTINSQVDAATLQAAPYAQQFKGKTAEETARKIFNFLKTKVNYVADPPTRQDVKLPSRLVADNKGDCKSYSLFTMAILNNLGYTAGLRYAGYSFANKPTHVYSFILLPNGQKIIIDAVWGHFNSEKPYTYKKDYLMQINVLAGIGNSLTDQGTGRGAQGKDTRQKTKEKLPANVARVQKVENQPAGKKLIVLNNALQSPNFVFIYDKTPGIFQVLSTQGAKKIIVESSRNFSRKALVVPVLNIVPTNVAQNNFLGVTLTALKNYDYRQVTTAVSSALVKAGFTKNNLGNLELQAKKGIYPNAKINLVSQAAPSIPTGAAQLLGNSGVNTLITQAGQLKNKIVFAYFSALNKIGQQGRRLIPEMINQSTNAFITEQTKANYNTTTGAPDSAKFAAFYHYLKGGLTINQLGYFYTRGRFNAGVYFLTPEGVELQKSIFNLGTLFYNTGQYIKSTNANTDAVKAQCITYKNAWSNAITAVNNTTLSTIAAEESKVKSFFTDMLNDSSRKPTGLLTKIQDGYYSGNTSQFLKFFPLSAASRGAFLPLVRFNVFGLGSLIYLTTLSMQNVSLAGFNNALNTAVKGLQIFQTWRAGGGNATSLKNTAEKGSKLKPLTLPLGSLKDDLKAKIKQLENSLPTGVNGLNGIGDPGLAASLATAAPFVAAMVPLIIALIPDAENNGLLASLGTTAGATCKPRVKNAEGKTVIELSNELACLNKITDLETAIQAAKDYTTLAADIATTKNNYAFEGGEPAVVLATLAAKAAQIVTNLKNQNNGGGTGSGTGGGTGNGKDNDGPSGGGSKTPGPTSFSPKTGLLLAGGLGLLLISNTKNK